VIPESYFTHDRYTCAAPDFDAAARTAARKGRLLVFRAEVPAF
jgi:hypothetical protein